MPQASSLTRRSEASISLIARVRQAASDALARRTEPICIAAVKLNGKWGFIGKDAAFLAEPLYGYVEDYSDGMAAFTLEPYEYKLGQDAVSWGFLDCNGKIAIHPNFSSGNPSGFREGLALVWFNGLAGFIRKDGSSAISPRFSYATDFENGIAVVGTGGDPDADVCTYEKLTFIDRDGRAFGRSDFEIIYNFSEGLAAAQVSGGVGYIDSSGEFVIAPRFLEAGQISGGFARVCADDCFSCGIINRNGAYVIEPIYGYVEPTFIEGSTRASRDGFDLLIGKNGETLFKCSRPKPDDQIDEFALRYGVANVRRTEGKSFYINRQGKRLTDETLDSENNRFRWGRGLVERSGRFGFVDSSGQLVIDTDFIEAQEFHEGYAHVRLNSHKEGLIDRQGDFVSDPKFLRDEEAHDGLTRFRSFSAKKEGFLDEAGCVAIEPKFKEVRRFAHGLARIKGLNGKYGFIDKQGKIVVRAQFEDARDFHLTTGPNPRFSKHY
jgi:hypothetical protein